MTSAMTADTIVCGVRADPIERYAATELQRYLWLRTGRHLPVVTETDSREQGAFIVGSPAGSDRVAQAVDAGELTVDAGLGTQGYVLHTVRPGRMYISANTPVGCLYGVYSLLQDHFGVSFSLTGDILPDRRARWQVPSLNERHVPQVDARGFLPWTNFPQSATSYSWEDWRAVIDRMARMRLNVLVVHNYNGELGHNEMFHNLTWNGITSRVWFATARSGHKWAGPGWDIAQYRFGADRLFGDCDWGSEAALHTASLTNEQVFDKGVSLFQRVIEHAHARGVRVALGLDIDLIMPEYGVPADHPEIIEARAMQVVRDYPTLDYLLCFQSEMIGHGPEGLQRWRRVFNGFYRIIKARAPGIQIGVSGWGLNPEVVASLPEDVLSAPIAPYSAAAQPGSLFGNRAYWAFPWLERDFDSSVYYYPYKLPLDDTVRTWRERSSNTTGFLCLTWRLADAVDPRFMYMSRAPWYPSDRYRSARDVYREYVRDWYGVALEPLAELMDGNEPVASLFSECQGTPPFHVSAMGDTAGFLLNIARLRLLPDGPTWETSRHEKAHEVQNAASSEGGECVGFIRHGSWIQLQPALLSAHQNQFEVRVASDTRGGLISVHLDTPDGPKIGECQVPNTGGWQTWTSITAPLAGVDGKHTLVLVFRAPATPVETERQRAAEALKRIDIALRRSPGPLSRQRLMGLRHRLAAAQTHITLNESFNDTPWDQMPSAASEWVQHFVLRVNDISSLGNVVSMQNRYIQLNVMGRDTLLRQTLTVQPPDAREAVGMRDGALLRWMNREPDAAGVLVYRNGRQITTNPLPPDTTEYHDRFHGSAVYRLRCVSASGALSEPSWAVRCQAGSADRTPPHIVMVSQPETAPEGRPVELTLRLLDNRDPSHLTGWVEWRSPDGAVGRAPVIHRVRAVFNAVIPAHAVQAGALLYRAVVSDGANRAVWPSAGWYGLTVEQAPALVRLPTPRVTVAEDGTLRWDAVPGAVGYRLYRSNQPDGEPGPQRHLTRLPASVTAFRDMAADLGGQPRVGRWYYRLSTLGPDDSEGVACEPVAVEVEASDER